MPATHLLVWNPAHYSIDDLVDLREDLRESGHCKVNWSVGRIKNISPGSRFFMIRLGAAPKGIVAAGEITSAPYPAERADESTGQVISQNFVDISFSEINTTPAIIWEELERPPYADYHWSARQSGPRIPDDIATKLEALWQERRGLPPALNAGTVPLHTKYLEGAVERVSVNRYERDPSARAACLAHYGYECQICSLRPAVVYGPEAEELIEVHHLVPMSDLGSEYAVDPIRDLLPVCPNCHAMIHHGGITRTPQEMKRLIADCEDDWDEQVANEAEE